MKYVNFFGNTISKLIVGDNPFTGHSYIEDVATGKEMVNYYTAENIKATLREIEAVLFFQHRLFYYINTGWNCLPASASSTAGII